MSKSVWMKAAVVTTVLLATVAAMAANGSGTITLSSPLQAHGKQFAAGSYKLSWSGSDENVQVTFRNGNEVITVPAKVVERPTPAVSTGVVYSNTASALQGQHQVVLLPKTAVLYNTSGTLQEINFMGKKTALVFPN